MKKRFNTIVLVISIISAFIIGFGSAYGTIIFRSLSSVNSLNAQNVQRFITVYNDINSGYYKKVNSEKLINSGINGMLSSLNDPYTQYIDSSQMESFNNNISGNVSGIGVVVTSSKNQIIVDSVVNDSPAKKAGIKANDIIEKIDNKSTKSMTLDETSKYIKGKTGTKVTLSIKRGNEEFKKDIVREKLIVTSVNYNVDSKNKNIGYIQISEFSDNTAKDLKNALVKLDSKKVKRVIIDLRSNPGGELDQAVRAASMFVKNGDKIVSTQDRSGKKVIYKAKSTYNGGFKFKKTVNLLVDSNTASAAEVFTAALNENNGTPIIGTKTFGKGIVQSVVPVDASSEVKFTSSKWLTPKNNWIHHKGIKPTIEVKSDGITNETGFKDYKTYKLGDKNKDIKFAQEVLNKLGYKVQITGIFDQETVNKIKQYQKDNNLNQDGQLTKKTKETMLYSLAKNLKENDTVYKRALDLK
ncbi:S41 family peptidase [Companilactobacillus sp. DQM5]|uniref:S41 family peptidase n=1 Tax=Companilactobacillus sp. DQM5 TaxID=3463359 RepID=UPI0040580A6D